ncbi:MAG: cysteine--tRNA ligase [Kiritimatiellia bacterium]
MKLQIFDTLSRQVQTVEPMDGKSLGFYCCGPTVYAAAHIGNFRTFVVQDVFRRVAELSGIRVKHVRNITNVDDKTIRVSQEQGLPLETFTRGWTEKFHRDCEALNLLPPQVEPGAVEHISEQISLIQSLIDKGVAYQAGDGSVFFRIDAFPEYGRLSGVKERELTTDSAAQADDEYGRDSMADFALWKAAKPEDGENVWESPWGPGRPGWHLECSAMSMKYLGPSFDVHSGGIDLAFPHHENEIAQSEACTGQTFCRLWFHVVHLMVDGKKMSKSLGNMYTLEDLEAKGFTPAEVRYGLIAGHYRKHLNFTVGALDAHRGNLQRLARLSEKIKNTLQVPGRSYEECCRAAEAAESLGRFAPSFDSLLDNLNVPKALGEMFRVAGEIEKNPASIQEEDAQGLEKVLYAMGIELPTLESAKVPKEVQTLAEERQQARLEKRWEDSDRLRDALKAKGWSVKDLPGGFELHQAGLDG